MQPDPICIVCNHSFSKPDKMCKCCTAECLQNQNQMMTTIDLKPIRLPKHVIEWLRNAPNNYAFVLNEKCIRCGQRKPILAKAPSGYWCCGECWSKFFDYRDPIDP